MKNNKLDNEYLEANNIIGSAINKLNIIYNKANSEGSENLEAYHIIENLLSDLESAERKIKYLAAPTKSGILVEDGSTQKFYIAYDDGSQSYNLSCASKLEILVDDEWLIGRVEATDGKYYFYGEGKPFLSNGMRVRKRIVE